MNCAEAKDILPELAGGDGDDPRVDEARAHASGCGDCATTLAELEAVVGLCRRAGAEPLPTDFSAGLRARLATEGPPPLGFLDRVRQALAARPIAWMAAAVGVAACITMAGTLRLSRPPQNVAGIAAAHVPQSKIALVKVDFVAEVAVDDVAFEVLLPDGLRFYSGGQALAEHSFQWKGKLTPGSNPIPIAVKGEHAGTFHVIAHATAPDLDVVQDVVIEVTS